MVYGCNLSRWEMTEAAHSRLGPPPSDFVAVFLDTSIQHSASVGKAVTNDNQIVTECVDCDHVPRGRLFQAGVMFSLLRKRLVGS